MLTPNTILQNRYQIKRTIGRGGMGAVYEAVDLRLQAIMALKETHFPDNPQLKKAFKREASLLANLRHPTLPRVSDYFLDGNGQFLVMEYIPGDDLNSILSYQGVPFTLDEVLPWANQLLDVLDYLHTRQPPVIHRDIKPSNLKLTARNQIVLLDFGLSKSSPIENTNLTNDTSVYGYTPNYASLEQIQNEGTDPRSDLYSLAATLYSLITGKTPPGAIQRAYARLSGLPDPLFSNSVFNSFGSSVVSEVLTKAMSLDREERFASAALMRATLFDGHAPGYSLSNPSIPLQEAIDSSEETYIPALKPVSLAGHSEETLIPPLKLKQSIAQESGLSDNLTVHLTSLGPAISSSELSPNTVLLRHSEIFRFQNEDIFEDLILHKDYERLWRSLIHAGGGRNLLTGYGPFGGTSLLRCAIAKARAELQWSEPKGGTLLVFYFRITKETKSNFEIEAESFGFGHLKLQEELLDRNTDFDELKARAGRHGEEVASSIMDFSLARPLKATFFEPAGNTTTTTQAKRRDYDFSDFVADLNAFFKQRKSNSALRQIVLRLIRSENLPSRVVFIIDRVRYLETLESLCKSELFSNQRIRAITVAQKENFDSWSNADRRLERMGFSKWYVPCLWKIDLDKSLFNNLNSQNQNLRLEYQKFLRHLEYKGRGSFGNIIFELKQPANTNFDSRSNYIDLDNLGGRADVQHNAWVQEVLNINWDTILDNMFGGPKQDEKTDRARIGIYHLIDWIANTSHFTKAEVAEVSRRSVVTISDNEQVNLKTVDNLLDVFLQNHYLNYHSGIYNLIWNKNKQPACRKVRLRQLGNITKGRKIKPVSQDLQLKATSPHEPDKLLTENLSEPILPGTPTTYLGETESSTTIEQTTSTNAVPPVGLQNDQNTSHDADMTIGTLDPLYTQLSSPDSTLIKSPSDQSILISLKNKDALAVKVFVSYSHADKAWLKRLRIHLKPLEREGRIDLWDDTKIKIGSKWSREIEQAISDANVSILLISANYIASDFIVNNELPPLLVACERSGTLILPVILSPCIFEQTSLSQFQAVNSPRNPLSSMKKTQQEAIFVKVVRAIEELLNAR